MPSILDWTLKTLRICREMRDLAREALEAFQEENVAAVEIVQGQMRRAVDELTRELPPDFPPNRIGDLKRHIGFSMEGDYRDILRLDVPDIEKRIEVYASKERPVDRATDVDELLHPEIR